MKTLFWCVFALWLTVISFICVLLPPIPEIPWWAKICIVAIFFYGEELRAELKKKPTEPFRLYDDR